MYSSSLAYTCTVQVLSTYVQDGTRKITLLYDDTSTSTVDDERFTSSLVVLYDPVQYGSSGSLPVYL